MQHASVSLALLAGGRSRRMGHDKAFADFAGTTLIEWLRDRVAGVFPHTFIVAKDVTRFRGLGLPVMADVLPALSPTVGVYSAVLASPTERTLCLGCDIPFVTPELLRLLADGSEAYDAFVPRGGGGLQPLCAVYSKSCLEALEHMLIADERRIDVVFDRVSTGYLDFDDHDLGDPERLFLNVNTQADLAAARSSAGEQAGRSGESSAGRNGAPPDDGHSAPAAARVQPDDDAVPILAPRVEAFLSHVALPTASFVGKKKSGKTTALAGVVAELRRRGRRVAAVKHDLHGFSIDVPGTDSHRLREAGAMVTLISSPEDVAMMSAVGEDLPLTSLVARIREPIDIVLTEGFMRQPAPKFEVSRAERSHTLIAPPEELLGIMADQSFPGHPARVFALDDYPAVADVLDALIVRWRAARVPRTGAPAPGERAESGPCGPRQQRGINERPAEPAADIGRNHD